MATKPKQSQSHALPGTDDITRVELSNGIIVLARENFTSPSVVMDGLVWGGSLLEPDDKVGLANFHGDMLMRGTKHHTFEQIFEEIESIGASLDIGASGHTYGFGSKSLAEDLPLMLKLAAEVLREPTFPADHVEKVRGEIMTSLHMRAHDTRRMANLAFHELAVRLVFRPLRENLGSVVALLGVFFASGLIHELVISLPAGGGYGLPTLYFLLQGAGILAERSQTGMAMGWGRGLRGRVLAFVTALGPVVLLFPSAFLVRVVLPLLRALGAVEGV